VGLGFFVSGDNRVILFPIIALCFLAFAIPCFIFVKERGNPSPRPVFGWRVIAESTRQTVRTLREGHRYPGLLRFLLGRVFYTDAINTVIAYMALYAVNVAVAAGRTHEAGERHAQLVLMVAITFAVIGGLLWGVVVDRIGPKRTLTSVLWLWMVTFVLASSVGAFSLAPIWLFIVASMAGVALGGIWTADRPYMLRLTPPDRVGEFYGLYGMVGRFSAVSGPLLWSVITYALVERSGFPPLIGQSVAIASLLGMIIVSYVILSPVTDEPRNWRALETPPLAHHEATRV
jgi:MFS transporter, UMF1 family